MSELIDSKGKLINKSYFSRGSELIGFKRLTLKSLNHALISISSQLRQIKYFQSDFLCSLYCIKSKKINDESLHWKSFNEPYVLFVCLEISHEDYNYRMAQKSPDRTFINAYFYKMLHFKNAITSTNRKKVGNRTISFC